MNTILVDEGSSDRTLEKRDFKGVRIFNETFYTSICTSILLMEESLFEKGNYRSWWGLENTQSHGKTMP